MTTNADTQYQKEPSKIRLQCLIFGILLIPVNGYWVSVQEAIWDSYPTGAVPYFNVIFILFVLTLFNMALEKHLPRIAFSKAELATLYVILSISTPFMGDNKSHVLIPIMGHAFWFATPENDWQSLLWGYLPKWLTVSDRNVLRGYYEGNSTLYSLSQISGWIIPALWWSLFAFVIVFIMLCINVVVRKQWSERERLSFPVVELPSQMTEPSIFFKKKLLWIGFSIAGTITIVNVLHFFFPIVPDIPVKRRSIAYLFVEKPWNAIGHLSLSFYPFVIGIGFIMPLELSFSIWFFYLIGKGELITGSMLGLGAIPDFPYLHEQGFGALMGLLLIPLWTGRSYFLQLFLIIFRKANIDDSDEPIKYRHAVWGIIGGMTFLVFFSLQVGMSIGIILLYFTIHFCFSTAVTRIRAEVGIPAHHLEFEGGYDKGAHMITFFGTQRLGKRTLTSLALFRWWTRDYASNPMPHQLEGFKFASKFDVKSRKLFSAMILAALFGIVVSFWAFLHIAYKVGAASGYMDWPTYGYGGRTCDILAKWLSYPTGPDFMAVSFMGIGFACSVLLMFLRLRFIWWPFHPLGYALFASWGAGNLWSCLLLSSAIKWLVLKYGGLKMCRRVMPFFLGLILGEFTAGSISGIISMVLHQPIYAFFP